MGVVYRAYHAQLERTGAIKVMQGMTPDADTVARFRHEAQAIAKLRHPNIVDVYDFGEFQGTPYMIVEYVPGGSLAARMAHAQLDTKTALKYLRGIAAGLDYAHSHGVVHRDVKPANVLLTAEDTPVLADFGLAKLLQGTSLKSMTGVTTGTPAYMAPEQVTGHQVGPAADRYSLATIAYEMLTGVIPFEGEALMELLYAQVHREPPAPSSRTPSLGSPVDEVIMRGLAKDPATRWESSLRFVDALEAAMSKGAGVSGRATMVIAPPLSSTLPRASAALADTVADPESAADLTAYPSPPWTPLVQERQPWRPTLAGIASVAVILLLLTGVVAWSLAHRPVDLVLSPSTAAAGDTVFVTADNLPASPRGQVELHSDFQVYDFRADSSGNVAFSLTVPRDTAPGVHAIKICWAGACHAQATLRVISRVAEGASTPAQSPTTTASSPSPTPSSCGATAIFVPSISKLHGFSATFRCFQAGSWSISVVQLDKPYGAGNATTPGNTLYYTQQFATPKLVAAGVSARVVACDRSSRCYSSAVVKVGA